MGRMPNVTNRKRPSMKDVADLAGVSRTTVSFVLNKKPNANIPPETQEKVWAAVDKLGYRPNAIARGLRAQRTHTIGFISDRVMTTPYAGQILLGAQDLAWEHNMLLLAINTGGDQGIKNAAVNMLLERQVDGILYAAMYHREVNPPPNIREVPTVLLDCFVADASLPSVVPNEVLGGYEATKILLDRGHQRVAHVSDAAPVLAQVQRLIGYRQALEDSGLAYDEDLVITGPSHQIGGYLATQELLSMSNPPTAIFCFNDRMAMGAYDAIRKLGLSIPGDVALVGFDNHEIIAAHLHPSLTTMQLPHYEMGRWAVTHLLQMIDPGNLDSEMPVQHKIRCEPIIRESV